MITIHYKKLIIALLAMLLVGCASSLPPQSPPPTTPPEPPAAPTPVVEVAEPINATLIAAGDNLIHDVIYQQAARRSTDGGHDFAPVYERLAEVVQAASFALVNQETTLAGEIAPLSNYPYFNSPTEVGDALVAMGFNMIATANNHSYDMGGDGIVASLDYWDTQPVIKAGSYRNQDERDSISYLTQDGLTVALVAATEHTNGISLKSGSEAGVLLLGEHDTLTAKLREAAENADLVVLSLHWGVEYSSKPTEAQRQLAQQLATAGADVIIGHHPHVLQGGEFLDTTRGRSYVAYSLGNFVSAQVGAANMAGGLLRVKVEKPDDTSRAVIKSVEFIPTVTHYGSGFAGLTVYPFADYTPQLAAAHGVRKHDGDFSYDYLQRQFEALKF